MAERSATESPEWLYFMAVASSVPRYWKAADPGVHVHDRVPEIARANADTLRTLALASSTTDNRAAARIGVLARPRGQSLSLRTNPDNPANRRAVRKILDDGALGRAGTFWYIPGWVLDAFLEPRKVSLPSSGVTFVELWGYRRGAPFGIGDSQARRTVIRPTIPEVARAQVLVVAGPTLAPRIIRPGTILDAYCIERRGMAGVVQVTDDASVMLAAMYVGRVLSEIPFHADWEPLPGEPVEHLVEFDADHPIIKEQQERGEESSGAPGLVALREPEDSTTEPPFAGLEATPRPAKPQRGEFIVFEEVRGDSDLRREEIRP